MNWRVIRRETRLIEHGCEHGIGHPDFYSAFRLDNLYGHKSGTWSVHGCDGCCGREDFPGAEKCDLEIYERFMDELGKLLPKNFPKWKLGEVAKWAAFSMHDATVNGIIKDRNNERYT